MVMAKKRGKRRKSQEVVNKHELPGGFWQQIVAFLMIIVSVLMAVSWFGQGGPAIEALRSGLKFIFGYTAYLLPVILTYLAVMIFRAPDNRLDPSVWLASCLIIFWFCGMFGVPSYGEALQTGGIIGAGMNKFVMSLVDSAVAIFIYIVLVLITALFMYAETPAALFRKIGSMFKTTKNAEDVANAKVMRRNANGDNVVDADDDDGMRNFKVNKNVELTEDEPRRSLIKNDVARAAVEEHKSAYMAVSDPNWEMPSPDLLDRKHSPADPGDTHKNALIIRDTLNQFGINVEIEGANVGPRITQYTLHPPAGIKVSKIAQLDKELALNLAKDKIRIEAPIPGTRAVGVEIPNNKAASVGLHELLKTDKWKKSIQDKPLAFAIGKDISGNVIVGNLAKMPHLLIAGTTGSGKSVMTNTLISSLLFHNSPSDLKLIIVDPKQVEMAAYNDIPHLLTPVITSVDKALSAMKWAVGEMDRRYTLMAETRVKNITDYNNYVMKKGGTVVIDDEDGNPQSHDNGKMPYIVIIVDEMADLMMMAGKELENLIVRIAQKGRASGIHLVLATQRPEVKVVTGLIKANIPGRIAFAVNNGVDSRVMLDMVGAEKLLGMGDMLYLTTEMMGKPIRVQGAFVSDEELGRITDFLRNEKAADYNDEVISQSVQIKGMPGLNLGASDSGNSSDTYRAAQIAIEARKLSTSLLQRKMGIGYGRAAKLMDELEEMGVISAPSGGNKPRDVLISSMDEYPGEQF